MRRSIYLILTIIFLSSSWISVQGQNTASDGDYVPVESGPDDQVLQDIKVKIQEYSADMSDLLIALSVLPNDSLYDLERSYTMAASRWKTYYEAVQMDIATSDELIDLVAHYQLVNQQASELLENMKTQAQAESDFFKAKGFIVSQQAEYKKMHQKAMTLQMFKKLAPMLEKLKAQEQVTFAEVESNYQLARKAVTIEPSLEKSMKALDECYFELKTQSDAIQAAVFKPFIERIKDKLLIAAALAIIMMFVTMVSARIEAIKKARDMAKKLKSQLMKNQDYPTI